MYMAVAICKKSMLGKYIKFSTKVKLPTRDYQSATLGVGWDWILQRIAAGWDLLPQRAFLKEKEDVDDTGFRP